MNWKLVGDTGHLAAALVPAAALREAVSGSEASDDPPAPAAEAIAVMVRVVAVNGSSGGDYYQARELSQGRFTGIKVT